MSNRRSVGSSSYSYSSSDSAFGENEQSSTTSPNPESVRATLDLYVSAAKVGREAYARGDLRAAVQQFDQALALELQTELDCIYDPSIGMVSGLVRREISERMHASPLHSPANVNCNKIMQSLLQIYTEAEAAARHRPADPRVYLRMGAALCCANEWEKAKKIYTDGLNMCKDRKELKIALRQLCRMEQITSGKEIPTGLYEPSTQVDTKLKSRTLPSFATLRLHKRKSASLEDMLSSSTGTFDNTRLRVSRSPGVNDHDIHGNRISKSPAHDNRRRGSKSPGVTDNDKNMSNPRRARRVSSFGRLSRPKKVHEVNHGERESWLAVFQSDFCKEQVQLKPSAITQMRRLSVDLLDQSSDDDQTGGAPLSKTVNPFTVRNFQSMRIESDDSELEDD